MSDFYYQNQLEISENICILFVLKLSLPTFLSVSLKPFKSLAEEKQFRIKYAHMFVQMASKLKNPKETKKQQDNAEQTRKTSWGSSRCP